MYDIGRKVYCKSLDKSGTIQDRRRYRRKAYYLVEFRNKRTDEVTDFMTGSADLIGHDWSCDSCDRVGRGQPFVKSDEFAQCFICCLDDEFYRQRHSRKKKAKT